MAKLRSFLSTVSLVLFLAGTSYAQVAVNNASLIFDDFSGGLNSKLSDFNLPKNQASVIQNLRFDTKLKSITKRDKLITYGIADASNPLLGMHRLYLSSGSKVLLVNYSDKIAKGNDTTGAFTQILDVDTGSYRWQWLTWHDLAIGMDGYNQPVKYDGSSGSATYLGTCLATDAGSGAGPDGTYLYKVSFYTSSYEVLFNVPSNSVTVSDNDITLTMIPIGPDTYGGEDVIGRKIYRTETGGATYKLLTNGTIADNSTVTLTDSDADGALGATYPAGDATYTPPKGKLCLVSNNRLWIANDPSYPSRIYYSEDGSHEVFINTSYFNIRPNDGDEITFIKNLLGKLTVGKSNTIQKIYTTGDSPSADWEISDPFSFVGSHAMYSAVNTPIGIIYLSNNGIYAFNGQNSELLSDAVTPQIRDIKPSNYPNVWGEYYKNAYYLTYTSWESGSSYNNRVLILDLLTKSYTLDYMNINILKTLGSGTDVEALYSGSSLTGKVYAHQETLQEVSHREHDDFGGVWDNLRYIPTSVGGDEQNPVIEIAWDSSIDSIATTINGTGGIIDRPDTHGYYTSQYLSLGVSSFDKIYWNESIPISGGDITLSLRAGSSSADCATKGWYSVSGDEFSNPAGSDISAVTADTVVQYRVYMTTDDIEYTPELYKANGYVVRITYNTVGDSDETSIPIRWESGWLDLGYPGMKKHLKKIYAYYDVDEDIDSTLYLKFEDYKGSEQTFDIDLKENPSYYVEYFNSEDEIIDEWIKMTLWESSLYDITFKELILFFDVEQLEI